MPLRQIEYVPVDELVPAVRNPKGHDIPGIRKSIEEFGVIEIGVLDDRTGRIISGHGRTEVYELLASAQAAGEEIPPPDGVDVREGRWFVPIVKGWASKSDEHAEAAVIAMNRLVERGGWLEEGLAEVLADLDNHPGLLELTGYTSQELADLLDSVGGPPDLDELADQLGDPKADAFWPVLRFKVPPDLRARYLALVASVDGGDAEQFAWMVEQAELRQRERKSQPATMQP